MEKENSRRSNQLGRNVPLLSDALTLCLCFYRFYVFSSFLTTFYCYCIDMRLSHINKDYLPIMSSSSSIYLFKKPKMQQCKLKTWTLNKTHQALTVAFEKKVTHKYTKIAIVRNIKKVHNHKSNLKTPVVSLQ